jgi:hypothetical protein
MRIIRHGFLFLFLLRICPITNAQTAEIAPVDQELIESRLRQCENSNNERYRHLREMFEKAGCSQLSDQIIKGFKLPNVICTLPGSTESLIIVGGHYDHALEYGRGAVDNWSGAALLPSLLQSLKNVPRKHTYLFVGFAGEENGLVGSRFFVKQLTGEQKGEIHAMVNLDCLGLASTKVELKKGNLKLVRTLNAVAKSLGSPLEAVNVDRVGQTDAYSFLNAKIPAISIHSVTPQTIKVLHSILDQVNSIQMKEYIDTYRLVAFYIAALDQLLPFEATPAGELNN